MGTMVKYAGGEGGGYKKNLKQETLHFWKLPCLVIRTKSRHD